jgi:hypothetical protein
MSPATAFDDRVVVSIAKRRRFDPRTLSALLKARELLALSLGLLLAKVRETADPLQGLMGRIKELEVLRAQAREEAEILSRGAHATRGGDARVAARGRERQLGELRVVEAVDQ